MREAKDATTLMGEYITLKVEHFIHKSEEANELPTCPLLSLDMKNMFNLISRERLRTSIMRTKYPELEAFSDMLYENEGQTADKMDDVVISQCVKVSRRDVQCHQSSVP